MEEACQVIQFLDWEALADGRSSDDVKDKRWSLPNGKLTALLRSRQDREEWNNKWKNREAPVCTASPLIEDSDSDSGDSRVPISNKYKNKSYTKYFGYQFITAAWYSVYSVTPEVPWLFEGWRDFDLWYYYSASVH